MIEVIGMSWQCAAGIYIFMSIFTSGLWWDDYEGFDDFIWGVRSILWPLFLPVILGVYWGRTVKILSRCVSRETSRWGK